jgi:hypothetical protein
MRNELLNLFYEKGFFRLARNIWFGISIFFLIVTIIYLFKGFLGNAIFCFGGFLFSYSIKKFLDSFIKSMKYRKDTKEVLDKKSDEDLEIIDAEWKE